MTIVLRRPWTRQPQQPILDKALAASLGLEAVATTNIAITRTERSALLIAAGSPTIGGSTIGIGPAFTSGDQRFTAGKIPALTSGPFTIEVLCSITAAASLAGFFSVPGNSVSAAGAARGLIAFGGGSSRNIYFWGSGADLASGVDWRIDGLPQHVFVTSAGSGQPITFYRDGEVIASGTTPTLISRAENDSLKPNFLVGDVNNGWGSSPQGVIALAAYYSKELSHFQIRERTKYPWHLFAPRQIIIPVAAAASAVPSITALSAENITATSADYRVTLDYA